MYILDYVSAEAKNKMITIREVAKLAGVSASTVSRVINGTAKVDSDKKERILRIIRKQVLFPMKQQELFFANLQKPSDLLYRLFVTLILQNWLLI